MSITKKITRLSLYTVSVFSALLIVFSAKIVFGADKTFSPLTGLPRITNLKTATLPDYINAVYLALIGFGALIAVVRIAWAGVKYSTNPGNHSIHESAKDDIRGVLLGLVILLIPFIVLKTINPDLTSLEVLKMAPKITTADKSIQISSEQQTEINNCLAKPGMTYDTAASICRSITATETTNELEKFCEKLTDGSTWNLKTETCDPPPIKYQSGTKVTYDDDYANDAEKTVVIKKCTDLTDSSYTDTKRRRDSTGQSGYITCTHTVSTNQIPR